MSAGQIFGLFAGILILCCLFTGLYSAGMYLIIKEDVYIFPTSTLDLACEDTYCLNACINRLHDFEIPSLNEHRDELLKQPIGYELARYKLEDNGQLKRIATPAVPDYLKPYQENTELHKRIWDYSTGIFPNDARVHLSYMTVYVNMNENRAAASIANLENKWRLYVNLADFGSPPAYRDKYCGSKSAVLL